MNSRNRTGRIAINIQDACYLAPAPSKPFGMDLYLRKVIHLQAHDIYRVILKGEDDEFEIESIGIQHDGGWTWGIDTVIPMRALETQGKGKNRKDCARQFKAAWERFAADEAKLTEFLNMKRKRR